MNKSRKITAIALVLILLFNSIVPVYAAGINKNKYTRTLAAGQYISLVNDFGTYYIRTETLDKAGNFTSNITDNYISESEYNRLLNAKDKDLYVSAYIGNQIDGQFIIKDGSKKFFVYGIKNKSGRYIDGSYIADIAISNTKEINYEENFNFLYCINDKYFNSSYDAATKTATHKPISAEEYSNLKLNLVKNNIKYIISSSFSKTNTDVIYSKDITSNGVTTTVVNATVLNADINDIAAGKILNYENVGNTVAQSNLPSSYTEWKDEYNEGYLGTWLDPRFSGEIQLTEWADPFWSNDEIEHQNKESTTGYYDDMNNYIKTDANGNVLPSENGIFDESGNFKPSKSDGYYDTDGIYHPIYDYTQGVHKEEDRIYIDEDGYFDENGQWHYQNNNYSYIRLHDGRYITTSGKMFDKNGTFIKQLGLNMFGNFFDKEYVYYRDCSIYEKKTKNLTLIDGTTLAPTKTESHIYYSNDIAIELSTYEKGQVTENYNILLNNGTILYKNDEIEYPFNIVYKNGQLIINQTSAVEASFDKGYIDYENYRLYPNGRYSMKNAAGHYVLDDGTTMMDGITVFENGVIQHKNELYLSYIDNNKNIVATNGIVINQLYNVGHYDSTGTFVQGTGYGDIYDENGNKISQNGAIEKNGVAGYYTEEGMFEEGKMPFENGYYTSSKDYINLYEGYVIRGTDIGYYEEDGSFVFNDGKFDTDGNYYQEIGEKTYEISSDGTIRIQNDADYVIDISGNIRIHGDEGTYIGNGLFLYDSQVGYFNENGRFVSSENNPLITDGVFYDSNKILHSINDFYYKNNKLYPLYLKDVGYKNTDNKITLSVSESTFKTNGMCTKDGEKGYYNAEGKFVKSNAIPYIGGFYTENGDWIDNLYSESGYYDVLGNYITPFGDIGYFDEEGEYILNKKNPYTDFFYDSNGERFYIKGVYKDSYNNYKTLETATAVNSKGEKLNAISGFVTIDGYTYIGNGYFINNKGEIGGFDSEKNFHIGGNSSDDIYMPNGMKVTENFRYNNLLFINENLIISETDGRLYAYTCDKYAYEVTAAPSTYLLSDGTSLLGETTTDSSETPKIEEETTEKTGETSSPATQEALAEQKTEDVVKPENTTEDTAEAIQENTEEKAKGFWIGSDYYIDSIGTGYYDRNGTYYVDGKCGSFDINGTFIEYKSPYLNGFFDSIKEWVSSSGQEPIKPTFNKYGMPIIPAKAEKTDFFYDYEGNRHIKGEKEYISLNGNVHRQGEESIGFVDSNNNLYLYGEKGYFRNDGTYVESNKIIGHHNYDGELISGKNTNLKGFYDMHGRWYAFGGSGYYDKDRVYHEKVYDDTIGYYDDIGAFNDGYNPYNNGYYNENGKWMFPSYSADTIYFDCNGNEKIGTNIYADGFYDRYKNWYPLNGGGYFDNRGSFHSFNDDTIGYYDADGLFYEGTNPHLYGYYDADKNYREFGSEGYYTANGTYVNTDGTRWYYTQNGDTKYGENPNTLGYFDAARNWHPFDENGMYTPNGAYKPFIIQISKYTVGSPDYILFEGIFKNEFQAAKMSKNTIQFSIDGQKYSNRYVDSAIRVSSNAMLTYNEAKELLHLISIYTKGTYIEDTDSCMLVYDGRIISFYNGGKISLKSIRDKFIGSSLSIIVARTRVGERYAMIESIETNQEIKVCNNGERIAIHNPLIVSSGAPYIALEDIRDLMVYDTSVISKGNTKQITLTLKDSAYQLRIPQMIILDINSSVFTTYYNGVETYSDMYNPVLDVNLSDSSTEKTIYIPISMLSLLTSKYLSWDTNTFTLNLSSRSLISLMEDN